MKESDIEIRRMEDADRSQVIDLIFNSTNAWYQKYFKKNVFGGDPSACEIFTDVYEDLDPGCCLIAKDKGTGQLAGSCFYHPRETHFSLGIMNASPDYFGKGVATRILDEIISLAENENLPVRLVSSAMNLDSFSLYTRRGFVPQMTFQDMFLSVPGDGLDSDPPEQLRRVRDAEPDDAKGMADLEMKLNGIRREKDFAYFINNESGVWGVSVIESSEGQITGFLCSVNSTGSKMLGPGISSDCSDSAALIYHELNARHRGNAPVFLIPVQESELVRTLYGWGAKNCEMHLCQVRGHCPPMNGVTMPTFMPETG
jgi:GNAT superfamily N-acetyltransferase